MVARRVARVARGVVVEVRWGVVATLPNLTWLNLVGPNRFVIRTNNKTNTFEVFADRGSSLENCGGRHGHHYGRRGRLDAFPFQSVGGQLFSGQDRLGVGAGGAKVFGLELGRLAVGDQDKLGNRNAASLRDPDRANQ